MDARNTLAELKEGFTSRSMLAILYGAIIMQPAVLYLQLYSGVNIASATQYLIILLLTQIGVLLGWPLSRQEIAILFSASGIASGLVYFLWPIQYAYLRTSPVTKAFGIADKLPWFVAPPENSPAIFQRLMFHSDWFPIMGTLGIGFALGLIADMARGVMATQLCGEGEELPFPISNVEAQSIIALAERRPDRMKTFIYSIMIGLVYSIILYTIPLITGFAPIPAPWVDLNYIMESTGSAGGLLGIATDLMYITIGFIVPFKVLVSAFVSGIIFYTIGGRILYQHGIFRNYMPGMSLGMALQFYTFDFLVSPLIGLSVAIAIMPIILKPKLFISALRSLSRLSDAAKRAGYIPLWILLALYFVGSFGTIALTLTLLPHLMPFIWILILLGPAWSFIVMLVTARALGETGVLITIPYVREGVFIAMPYSGYDIWFAPFYVAGYTFTLQPASWAGVMKTMKLTGTRPSSFIKAYLFAIPLALLLSFIYASSLWVMTEIPSTYYPYTAVFWPISAMYTSLWVTKRITILNPEFIAIFFLIGAAIYAAAEIAHLPISPLGVYLGAATAVPYTILMFIGAIVGKYLLPRFLGAEWWQQNRMLVVGGILCGEAVAVALGAIISLIGRSMWIMPY
ncbi:MAG: hypothetical protein QXV74_00830 [Candidatus Bathyarchaeia archaeon]